MKKFIATILFTFILLSTVAINTVSANQHFDVNPGFGGQGINETHTRAGEELKYKEVQDDINAVTNTPECTIWTQDGLKGCLANLAYYILYMPAAWLLSLSGELLDFALDWSTSSSSYNSSFVNEGWAVVRDISNIFFILVLIYIAISVVLGIGNVDAKKMITTVIIVALLINFSLFMSKAIIDTSNVLARLFYHNIVVKTGDSVATRESSGKRPISQYIADRMHIDGIIKFTQSGKQLNIVNNDGNLVSLNNEDIDSVALFLVLVIIFAALMAVAFYAFFVVAFLLIGRVIGLWISMILVPLVFITYIIPKTGGLSRIGHKKWWADFLGLCFFAPMFIFFLYLIAKFLEIDWVATIFKGDNIASQTTMGALIQIVVPFLVVLGLLTTARKLSQQYAGEAGGFLVNNAIKVAGMAGGVAMGAAAFAGRNTVGRMSNTLSRRNWLNELGSGNAEVFANKGIGKTLNAITKTIAGGTVVASRKVARSSFDVRQNEAANTLSKMSGFNFDQGAKTMRSVGLKLDTKSTAGGYVAQEQRKEGHTDKTSGIFGRNQHAYEEARNKYLKAKGDAEDEKESTGKVTPTTQKRVKDAKEAMDGIKNARKLAYLDKKRRQSGVIYKDNKYSTYTDSHGNKVKYISKLGEIDTHAKKSVRAFLESFAQGLAEGGAIELLLGSPFFTTFTTLAGALRKSAEYSGYTNRHAAEHKIDILKGRESDKDHKHEEFKSSYKGGSGTPPGGSGGGNTSSHDNDDDNHKSGGHGH